MYRKEIRKLSREQLGNNVLRNRWITMMALCVSVILADVYLTALAPFTGFLIGPVFGILIGGPLIFGVTKALLECANGERWSFTYIFHGFTDCFGGSMILGFLEGVLIMLWTALLIVPGVIKSYAYSLAFYIQCENTEMEAIDCLHQSEDMMKGHKMELFKLDLSFFGWYRLGALCLGVGILFVIPYHELARTNFYLRLKNQKEDAKFQEIIKEMEAEA